MVTPRHIMNKTNWCYIQPNKHEHDITLPLSYYLLFVVCTLILAGGFMYAIDKYFDQQDRMLCESAKVSGNTEYQEKCKCFYAGEAISCTREEI